MKVLLVDDDLDLIKYLATALTEKGWQVRIAHDAEEAYQCSQRDRPDVMVLDIHMPGGGGKNALKRVRESHKSFDVPVLFMSADADTALSEEMRKLQADGFIEKPLELDRLHQALMRLTEGKMA
jgi:DNA-binding response OmpR family regulator